MSVVEARTDKPFQRGHVRFLTRRSEKSSDGESPTPHDRWNLEPRRDSMPRNSPLVLILLLGSLVAPASAYAQLTPPAGSAGAGSTANNGIPFGPANPSVVLDP